MRRWVRVIVVLAGIGALALAMLHFGVLERSVVSADLEAPLSSEAMAKLAARGRYLVVAADCYACHTHGDGPPWAGGLPFETPFGTIHATNISPDADTGIGKWTRRDFHRALRDGIAPGNRHLYPAMPYASYRDLTADDVDAMYAYLMTCEPISRANVANDVNFPNNIRALVGAWNMFVLRAPEQPDASKSAEWNRGRYLTNALGHCGECHTPRNFLMAMKRDRYLQGAVLEGVEAPDIRRDTLALVGFEPEGLARFMRLGVSPLGSMTGPMFEVVHFSTQYLDDADLAAMATYLLGEPPPPVKAVVPVEVSPKIGESGRRTWFALCAGCHGIGGEGLPQVSVPMRTNSSLRIPSPRGFLTSVMRGIAQQDFPGLARMQAMPGFAEHLGDQEIADLATWARATWGGQGKEITAAEVAELRR
ncbi:MAG TPA: cytochrome c [Steroidobacteraceae bacterium]|nr:cytochrome c [Steroidobacteraceae bacterium]